MIKLNTSIIFRLRSLASTSDEGHASNLFVMLLTSDKFSSLNLASAASLNRNQLR